MKRLVIFATALGLAVPLAMSFSAPADAGSRSVKKSYKIKKYSVKRGWFRNRGAARGPQVKGFTAQVGGYSFNVGTTFAYDPLAPQPNDWPRHDVSPPRNGIIPTSPYP